MTSSVNLRCILDMNKLTGPNFLDWYRNLKIVLRAEHILYVLDDPIMIPPEDATEDVLNKIQKHKADSEVATCIMLASMSAELQKQHEHMDAHTIIMHLLELFDEQSRSERYEISKLLFQSKMAEGSSAVDHALKLLGYIERLGSLGFAMDHELSIDLILQSLPKSYSQFVLNFQMNKIEVTIPELINMLKTAEPSIKNEDKSGHADWFFFFKEKVSKEEEEEEFP